MNKQEFIKNIEHLELLISKDEDVNCEWVDDCWFMVNPQGVSDSAIDIRFLHDEIRVGIGNMSLSFSDKYNGMEYKNGYTKFIKLLGSNIRRVDFYKGKHNYMSYYETAKSGIFEEFGTSMTLSLFFWKKTVKKINLQEPVISDEKLINELNAAIGLGYI